MKKINKKDFFRAKDPIEMTPGEMLYTLRQLQNLSQAELGKIAGMSQANISNMESGRQEIGRLRALALAKALRVHPGIILFPNYQIDETDIA